MKEQLQSLQQNFISFLDYTLLPFYLVLIFAIAVAFRNKHYPPGHTWRPYFLPALIAKVAGAIFISMIYQYYYSGGDTANYYYHASVINSALNDSFTKWLGL